MIVHDVDNTMTGLEIRCYSVPWNGKVSFCLLGRPVGPEGERQYFMATNVTFEPIAEGETLQPTFSLRRDQVQALMDEMYRIGVRPTEQGTAGELEATKSHLKDMRNLVASALEVPELRSSR